MKIFPVMVDDTAWVICFIVSVLIGGYMNFELIKRYAIVLGLLFLGSVLVELMITVITGSQWEWSIVFLFWIGETVLMAFLLRE